MLTVTDAAGAHLAEMLSSAPEKAAIRFVAETNGLTPRIDSPRPEDATFEHNDRVVLILDQPVASALDEKTLDVRGGDQDGQHLVLL